MSEIFLYLTTIGRKSGMPRQIEIWFVKDGGCYYMVSEGREQANWVQNIQANPDVQFSVGIRSAHEQERPRSSARARVLRPGHDDERSASVQRLMNAKYGWSDGLIVELEPLP